MTFAGGWTFLSDHRAQHDSVFQVRVSESAFQRVVGQDASFGIRFSMDGRTGCEFRNPLFSGWSDKMRVSESAFQWMVGQDASFGIRFSTDGRTGMSNLLGGGSLFTSTILENPIEFDGIKIGIVQLLPDPWKSRPDGFWKMVRSNL